MTAILSLLLAFPAAELTAKTESLDPPTELAEPVRAVFAKEAIIVADAAGPVLTIWFRSSIPAKATAEQITNGLTYREIPEGTLIALITFAKPFVDFRKQEIAAGTYTLRAAVQPETGDHAGTAPHPEFVLLTPADKDKTADAIEPKTLVKQSSATTGGDHPGVMLLFPHAAKTADVKLAAKPDGVTVLTCRRAIEADGGKATLGFALVVAGHSPKR